MYKKSDYVKKHFEKLGFTSSEDLKNRYGDYVDSMDPYKDYFCDTNMGFLCVFFVHSTILVISNCIFGFNPPKEIEQPYGFYALFLIVGIGLFFGIIL